MPPAPRPRSIARRPAADGRPAGSGAGWIRSSRPGLVLVTSRVGDPRAGAGGVCAPAGVSGRGRWRAGALDLAPHAGDRAARGAQLSSCECASDSVVAPAAVPIVVLQICASDGAVTRAVHIPSPCAIVARPCTRVPGRRSDPSVSALRSCGYPIKKLQPSMLKGYHKFWKYIAGFLLPASGEERAPGISRRQRPAIPGSPEEAGHGPLRPDRAPGQAH
jgi:hypothetical protein